MEYLKNVEFVKSVFNKSDLIRDDLPIIAMVGKSNVGKSSFINTLTNNKNTAKVGQTPGKTKCLNFFLVDKKFYLVDLPGYGYSTMSEKEKENINKLTNYFLENNKNIKHIFSLIDIRHLPSKDDRAMYDWLVALEKDFTIILNKADKLSNTKIEANMKDMAKALFAKEEMIPFSTETKLNLDKVLDIIKEKMN
ncbi:MAG: YihA family ribosome biogenesis GTP-binding protein [Clostridia bacterium]|nr:YihA family ribosome biogenesis GTP-binding protein [Clostridia bacterium]MBR6640933.1 YihA family ribosome biogenesis GTP-binding protein [Clostridia bacterium]